MHLATSIGLCLLSGLASATQKASPSSMSLGTLTGTDPTTGLYYECYTTGHCKRNKWLHGYAQDLRNRVFANPPDANFLQPAAPNVLLDCAGDGKLCLWPGDRKNYQYNIDDLRRAIDVIYSRCGGCGLAHFDKANADHGSLQMSFPCYCQRGNGQNNAECDVDGTGNKVLSTNC